MNLGSCIQSVVTSSFLTLAPVFIWDVHVSLPHLTQQLVPVPPALYIPLKPPPLCPPLYLMLPGPAGLWYPPSRLEPVKSLPACWKPQTRAAAPAGPKALDQTGVGPRRPPPKVVRGPSMEPREKGWLGNRARWGCCRRPVPHCCCWL